ncbi:hypothetical protein KQX54_005008 [Cotesia glomerata]|uniref:Uncharacterized protein n=1 Tax=Cotesia glomerata TaxID=32391 RepID=A0AAV7IL11_COTGL|nr:hypothetical protein KQX54_005008 [Cotesia glomerata]
MSEDYEENYDDNDDEIDQDTIVVSQEFRDSNVIDNFPQMKPTSNNDNRDSNNRFQPLHIECDPNAWELATSTESLWELQNTA